MNASDSIGVTGLGVMGRHLARGFAPAAVAAEFVAALEHRRVTRLTARAVPP